MLKPLAPKFSPDVSARLKDIAEKQASREAYTNCRGLHLTALLSPGDVHFSQRNERPPPSPLIIHPKILQWRPRGL